MNLSFCCESVLLVSESLFLVFESVLLENRPPPTATAYTSTEPNRVSLLAVLGVVAKIRKPTNAVALALAVVAETATDTTAKQP